jgi:transitional endoplasmic reticulum ATPase
MGNVLIDAGHFETALDEVGPSVDAETRERYEEIEQRFDKRENELEETDTSRTFQ